jgi:hypothetical protein
MMIILLIIAFRFPFSQHYLATIGSGSADSLSHRNIFLPRMFKGSGKISATAKRVAHFRRDRRIWRSCPKCRRGSGMPTCTGSTAKDGALIGSGRSAYTDVLTDEQIWSVVSFIEDGLPDTGAMRQH